MKKRLLSSMLVVCTMAIMTGCGQKSDRSVETSNPENDGSELEKPTEEVQNEFPEEYASYEELLSNVRTELTNEYDPNKEYEFSKLVAMYNGEDPARLGYLLEDLDGNGVEELIFGENDPEPGSVWNGVIYDIYTIADGKLIHVADGWERNRFYLCENGMIANEGSSGASSSNYDYFTFKDDQLTLVEAVVYEGDVDSEHPWFYSTKDQYYTKDMESISEEKAIEIQKKYVHRQLEFTPFLEEK